MSSYDRKDHLYTKAKEEGYRSRAAYKLLEIQKKYKIIRAGDHVCELGSFPGGWLQVAAEETGPKGLVVGIDLRELPPFRKEEFTRGRPVRPPKVILGDALSSEVNSAALAISSRKFDVVLSDMSPHLTGVQARDTADVTQIISGAFEILPRLLRDGGGFVIKVFPSPEVDIIFRHHKGCFKKLARAKLNSTRSTSNEFYLIGTSFTAPAT